MVENIMGKGENADFQHFLLFPQCSQKPSLSNSGFSGKGLTTTLLQGFGSFILHFQRGVYPLSNCNVIPKCALKMNQSLVFLVFCVFCKSSY